MQASIIPFRTQARLHYLEARLHEKLLLGWEDAKMIVDR